MTKVMTLPISACQVKGIGRDNASAAKGKPSRAAAMAGLR